MNHNLKKIPINYTSNWKLSTTSDFERVELCVSSSSGLEAEVWARLKSLREIYGLEWFIWRQLVKHTFLIPGYCPGLFQHILGHSLGENPKIEIGKSVKLAM